MRVDPVLGDEGQADNFNNFNEDDEEIVVVEEVVKGGGTQGKHKRRGKGRWVHEEWLKVEYARLTSWLNLTNDGKDPRTGLYRPSNITSNPRPSLSQDLALARSSSPTRTTSSTSAASAFQIRLTCTTLRGSSGTLLSFSN